MKAIGRKIKMGSQAQSSGPTPARNISVENILQIKVVTKQAVVAAKLIIMADKYFIDISKLAA